MHYKPRLYEMSFVCDYNSLARPYRVDVQNVSMRSDGMPNKWRTRLVHGYTKFDFTVDKGKGRLNPSRERN